MPLRPFGRVGIALLVAMALPVAAASSRADDACDVEASRVVAVGDVHGSYDNFVAALQLAGVVDENGRWTGGTTHLVQTGDLTDRGRDTRRVLDLLMSLEKEAKKAGGRVHALLGNHEVMNVLGDLRYVNPEEYEFFRTADSMRRIQRFWANALARAEKRARQAGEEFDAGAFRKDLEKRAPIGFVERTRAFSESGEYGRWLRKRSTVARVNGIVFLHGGLTPEVAELGCKEINKRVRRELTRDIDKTRREAGKTLAAGGAGPLWYRGLAKEDETAFAPSLDKILEVMDARAIVVAHTVTTTGRIQDRFGGRVIMIDVGLSPAYHGKPAALEIAEDGTISALYPNASEILSLPPGAEPAEVEETAVAGRP